MSIDHRDAFFDVLKFAAIFLVVFGHVSSAARMTFGSPYVSNAIVGMNMPLFFTISGYFSYSLIEQSGWGRLGARLKSYFWPLATTSLIFSCLAVCPFGLAKGDEFCGYCLRLFLFPKWYIWCLAIMVVVTFSIWRCVRTWTIRLLLVLLFWIGLMFLRDVWFVGNVRAMLPYFIFGLVLLRRQKLWERFSVVLPCAAFFILLIVFEGDVWKNGLSFYSTDTTWWGLTKNWNSIFLFGAQFLIGISGSLCLMGFLFCALKWVPALGGLASLGTTTLWVYLLHHWILDRMPVDRIGHSFWAVLTVAILLFSFCHLLATLIRRQNVLRRALMGDVSLGGVLSGVCRRFSL